MYVCVCVWKIGPCGEACICVSLSSLLPFHLALRQVSQSHSLLFGAWQVLLSICWVPKGKLSSQVIQTYILQSLATYFTLSLGFILFRSCFWVCVMLSATSYSHWPHFSCPHWEQIIKPFMPFWAVSQNMNLQFIKKMPLFQMLMTLAYICIYIYF